MQQPLAHDHRGTRQLVRLSLLRHHFAAKAGHIRGFTHRLTTVQVYKQVSPTVLDLYMAILGHQCGIP